MVVDSAAWGLEHETTSRQQEIHDETQTHYELQIYGENCINDEQRIRGPKSPRGRGSIGNDGKQREATGSDGAIPARHTIYW